MRALLAFRHGEAAVNRPDLFVPGADDRTYPLTDIGVGQAERAGVWAAETFDWVKWGAYVAAVSQFVRAQQTYRDMGLPETPLLVHPGLNEQDWGDFMSADPPEELRASFDADYETHIAAKAPHGESTLDLYHRLRAALSDLTLRFGDASMVLVTHGRALMVLRMILERVPPTDAGWHFVRRNASELSNCGALYYPDLRLPSTLADAEGRLATLNPPYSSYASLSWEPYLGAVFEPDPS